MLTRKNLYILPQNDRHLKNLKIRDKPPKPDYLPYICLLLSDFSNVCHFTCIWPRTLKLGCIANVNMLFLMNGFICLFYENEFMLISGGHISNRSMYVCMYVCMYTCVCVCTDCADWMFLNKCFWHGENVTPTWHLCKLESNLNIKFINQWKAMVPTVICLAWPVALAVIGPEILAFFASCWTNIYSAQYLFKDNLSRHKIYQTPLSVSAFSRDFSNFSQWAEDRQYVFQIGSQLIHYRQKTSLHSLRSVFCIDQFTVCVCVSVCLCVCVHIRMCICMQLHCMT